MERIKIQTRTTHLPERHESVIEGMLRPLDTRFRAKVIDAIEGIGPCHSFDIKSALQVLVDEPDTALVGLREALRPFVPRRMPSPGASIATLLNVLVRIPLYQRATVAGLVHALCAGPNIPEDWASPWAIGRIATVLSKMGTAEQSDFVLLLKPWPDEDLHGQMFCDFVEELAQVPEIERSMLVNELSPYAPKHLSGALMQHLRTVPCDQWHDIVMCAQWVLHDGDVSMGHMAVKLLCQTPQTTLRHLFAKCIGQLCEHYGSDASLEDEFEELHGLPSLEWSRAVDAVIAANIPESWVGAAFQAFNMIPADQWADFSRMVEDCGAAASAFLGGSTVVALAAVPLHERAQVLAHFKSLDRIAGRDVLSFIGGLPEEARFGAVCALRALVRLGPRSGKPEHEKDLAGALSKVDIKSFQALEVAAERGEDAVLSACIEAIVMHVPPDAGWRNMPYSTLWPLRDRIQASLETHHLQTVGLLGAKAFDRSNATHRHVGALAWLSQPHAYKFLCDGRNTHFDYDACTKLAADNLLRLVTPLASEETAESWYLAYETSLVYEQHVQPAMERARMLGVPLMLVANVSYGGTAATALPLRQMQKDGVRVVFTKQGSTEAHGNREVLTSDLFTPETENFIATQRPIVLVLDGSEGRYPDGMRGYRNFAALLNQTAPFDSANAWTQEDVDNSEFTPSAAHAGLQSRLHKLQHAPVTGPAQPFGMFYASLTHTLLSTSFGETPGAFDWSKVDGPAFVCLQTSLFHSDIVERAEAGEPRAQALLARPEVRAGAHVPVFFDDNPAQLGVAYLGRYGPKVKSLLHRTARNAFKRLCTLEALSEPKIRALLRRN